MVISLTPFEAHCQKWRNGCGAEECGSAFRKVFARGSIPCQVLIVGEAPGHSEDLVGYPFKGPAGLFQDEMLKTVNFRTNGLFDTLEVGFCNLVCCIPYDTETDKKTVDAPLPEQVKHCMPRLEEFIALCNPTLIIAVGKQSEHYLEAGYAHSVRLPRSVKEIVPVPHPAYILRAETAKKSMFRRRYIDKVTNAITRHFGGAKK